ncbi:hypothetical protein N824_09765 [Pedobacter sp. V48]|nr:hypothetical protein N824_09765 [Pedobacter sp. V48]
MKFTNNENSNGLPWQYLPLAIGRGNYEAFD